MCRCLRVGGCGCMLGGRRGGSLAGSEPGRISANIPGPIQILSRSWGKSEPLISPPTPPPRPLFGFVGSVACSVLKNFNKISHINFAYSSFSRRCCTDSKLRPLPLQPCVLPTELSGPTNSRTPFQVKVSRRTGGAMRQKMAIFKKKRKTAFAGV